MSKGAIFRAIGGATPQKTKAPKLLSRAPLSATFGAPGPFRGTFQGQAAPIKRHKGGWPQESTSPRTDVSQRLDRPQECMDLRHLRAYWPTGPAPESQSWPDVPSWTVWSVNSVDRGSRHIWTLISGLLSTDQNSDPYPWYQGDILGQSSQDTRHLVYV